MACHFCVLLQKGTQGPPQPPRQRAPPAKTPREAEARPKLSRRLNNWGRREERKGRDVENGVCIGCPQRGCLRSLPACLEPQQPRCSPFFPPSSQIVMQGAEVTAALSLHHLYSWSAKKAHELGGDVAELKAFITKHFTAWTVLQRAASYSSVIYFLSVCLCVCDLCQLFSIINIAAIKLSCTDFVFIAKRSVITLW